MKRAYVFIGTAWLLQAVAWFVPVVKDGVSLPKGIPGWEAFRVASSTVWPYEGVHYDTWYIAALATTSAVFTLVFIFGSPWVVLRGPRQLRRVAAWVAAAAFIVNSHWYVLFGSDRADLRIGYFLWWSSFLLLSVGLFDLAGQGKADKAPLNANGGADTARPRKRDAVPS